MEGPTPVGSVCPDSRIQGKVNDGDDDDDDQDNDDDKDDDDSKDDDN